MKESDITSLDIFLEKGMPYTEVTRSGNVDNVITQFLSGVSIMTIDGFDECLLIDCRTYPMRSVSEFMERQGVKRFKGRFCGNTCIQCSTFKKKDT